MAGFNRPNLHCRHVRSVEKMKEVQEWVSGQVWKMVNQSSNDLNQIRDQILNIENQNDLSNQKISESDMGS